MRWQTTTVLALLGLFVVWNLLYILSVQDSKPAQPGPTAAGKRHAEQSALPGDPGMLAVRKFGARGPETASKSTVPVKVNESFVSNSVSPKRISIDQIPSIQEFVFNSDPRVSSMFEDGLSYMASGKFLEARLAFQTIIRSYPGCPLEAPAYFALGVSFYREGGTENLLIAADQFRNFMIFFPREPEYEEFRKAAQIDVALIESQLMQAAQSDKDKLIAAQAAAKAFSSFLLKWPNDTQAPAASVSLKEIRDFLSAGR